MCDDLFSDCSCDDDCCDLTECCCDLTECCCDLTDCCGCCPSNSSNATSGDAAAAPSVDQGDHDCLYYLCCAGCFLCPLFYVGYKRQTVSSGESIPVEASIQPLEKGNYDDTATIAASTTTAETGNAVLANDLDRAPLHSIEPAVEASTPMQRN
jgi:hypothetical protein